ncbi:hypothetical protein MKQ68_10800 [Chitinophaga horti]|uniref:DNA alkylation repair enzyme n=1 Tax=Chitinophaga horti TaxID=2920382 RepID=A0ABY6JBM0_9BACT|nr:hypothetical protein [Chitinophaga horti]UYQ95589.1 hypothetical protein MKQ68_10800 [Chitinophaga horti]
MMFITKSEGQLISELSTMGFSYDGIDDIYKQKSLPHDVVRAILRSFKNVYQEHLGSGDHLLRSLISADEPFDPTIIIDFFEENTYNMSVMWGVAYVLAMAKTYDIGEWLKNQLLKEPPTFERQGLVYGLIEKGGFKDSAELKSFLEKIFPKYPFAVIELYKKVGSKEDALFLEGQRNNYNSDVNKEIDKLIVRLGKKKR